MSAQMSISDARAYVDRVLTSVCGAGNPMPVSGAVSELEDTLSALDAAGYRVEGRQPARAAVASTRDELEQAVNALIHLELKRDADLLRAAGAHVETALQHFQWRLKAPESPVLERVIAIAGAAAGTARPLAE